MIPLEDCIGIGSDEPNTAEWAVFNVAAYGRGLSKNTQDLGALLLISAVIVSS